MFICKEFLNVKNESSNDYEHGKCFQNSFKMTEWLIEHSQQNEQ